MTIEERINKIKYEAVQIPERSDNSEFKDAVHWRITMNNNVITEYSEGIGHFFNCNHSLFNKLIAENIINKVKTAQKLTLHDTYKLHRKQLFKSRVKFNSKTKSYDVQPPEIKDILYSLTMDSDAINYEFGEWCLNYGYDEDSRKALAIWHECTNSYRKLRALGFTLEELQEYFQDY